MIKNPPSGLVLKPESFFRRKQRQIHFYLSTTFRLHFIHFLVCFAIIAGHMMMMDSRLLQRLEYVFLDLFYRQRPPITQHAAITHIDMAEDSLHVIGRWPWPRHNHAALTHILHEWGARAVVFDVIFSEPSTSFDDESLTESLKESGLVYLPSVLETFNNQKEWIHSLPEFKMLSKGTGHVNVVPDSDGTLRRIVPYLEYNNEIHPYIALRVAYDALGKPMPHPKKLPFPTDSDGNMMINWAGKWRDTFDHISFIDLIKSYAALKSGATPLITPDRIKGKICVIGLTAVGLTDIKANPLEEVYPAVGVQTNILNSILTNQFVYPASRKANLICLLLVGFFASLIFIFSKQILSLIMGLAWGFVWILFAFVMFSTRGIWFFALNPLLLIFSLFVFFVVFTLTIGNRERERLFTLATRDGLTGLYVIRHFRMLLNDAVIEAHKKKTELSVILFDIDFFKKVNDTFGHAAGDAVLKRLAQLMREVFPEDTKKKKNPYSLGRYGGEEFIILIRNCSLLDAAFNFGEKLRKRVEQEVFVFEGKEIPFTLSLGVATLGPTETVPDLMVHRADEALYRAKTQGRNRTCIEKDEGAA
ncbi:MAG TPA: CHASE2 domain-containing protein [Candidatus Omnitrophota bacterium]|nr:CHASE2 domain-containing protein [Candidatus Omnitrophota bacterium]